jgi:hypothetical protein
MTGRGLKRKKKMKNPYLPKSDQAKVPWIKNLNTKAPDYATVLDITHDELTSLNNDSSMFIYIMNTMLGAYDTAKQEVTKFKNIMRDGPLGSPNPPIPTAPVLPAAPTAVEPGIFPRISKFVSRLKSHPNYTASIGENLGIEGSEHVVDIQFLKPILKGGLDAGRPRIIWKKDIADSIDIFVDRGLTGNYEYLANDMEPDYIDTFPLPTGVNSAVWAYKGIYKISDEKVGQMSDPINVTVTKLT